MSGQVGTGESQPAASVATVANAPPQLPAPAGFHAPVLERWTQHHARRVPLAHVRRVITSALTVPAGSVFWLTADVIRTTRIVVVNADHVLGVASTVAGAES